MVQSFATPIPRAPACPPVLALLIEGLRPADLSRAHSPFLERLRATATVDRPLRGAPGEQCWGEVFAGAWPEQTGTLAPWTLDPAVELPLGNATAWMYQGLDLIWPSLRRFLGQRGTRRPPRSQGVPPPAFLPPALRQSLRAADDPNLYLRPGGARLPSLMDSLLAAGCRVEMTAFPGSPGEEKKLISRLGHMSRAFLDRHDLYLARLPGANRLVLHHGPNSPERYQLVREVDGMVERLVSRFRQQWLEGGVLVASVRGSVAAQTYLDAGKLVQRLTGRYGLRPYRDYAMLVNRTMVRMWALSPAARSVFPFLDEEGQALRRHGTLLTRETATHHNLPPPGSAAGDWIWFARPGVVVFPNDDDLVRPRAATGYGAEPPGDTPRPEGKKPGEPQDKKDSESKPERPENADGGFVILSAPGREPEEKRPEHKSAAAWRVDLCVTLATMLEVRIPVAARGRSLVPRTERPAEKGK